ncbi:MAG TPA: tetratricopeptide repeat protein [Candidatus Dormibacteraeota bacterium]|nr:tetratricopeptide repeat protein [Candidatus Dormibacteraeota bacterium]
MVRRALIFVLALLLAAAMTPLAARAESAIEAVHTARQLIAAGNMTGALRSMELYVARHPDQPDALRFLGDLYYRAGQMGRAEATYRQALDIDPRDRETHNRLGTVYAAENRVDDAIDQFNKSLPGISSVGDLVVLHERKGDLQQYRLQVEQAVEKNPSDADLVVELAQVYAALYHPTLALGRYRRALNLDPTSIPAINGLGLVFLDLHDPTDAIDQFETCLRLDPFNYSCTDNLGVAYMDLHRDDLALPILKRAYQYAPERPEAIVNFGYIEDDRGNWKAAVTYYAQAIRVWPYGRDAYFNIAIAYETHHLYQLAQAALLEGLAVSPDDGWMHYLLGETYLMQGHHDLAKVQFQAATTAIDPSVVELAKSALSN